MEDDAESNTDNWLPPSEAEMKIIEARRERSDKISKVMGQYLLKGYKMLSSTCDECGTILLEDRQHELYCVACSEVDSEHTKDNPALSGVAARRQIEESEHRTNGGEKVTSTRTLHHQPEHHSIAQAAAIASSEITVVNNCNSSWYSEGENALQETIAWAAQGLRTNRVDLSNSIQYCTLIKMCADAYISLKAVKDANMN